MIRAYRPSDLATLRRICLLTGAAGGDATGRWSDDELLADLFLEPYTAYAPEWVFVVEQDGEVVGYLVAVPDTAAFVDWWRDVWTPVFARRHPRPRPPSSAEGELVMRGYDPGILLIPELASHPAHLHIDLLPRAQGHGWGRQLIETLRSRLAEHGVPAVHLSMDPANAPARAFYDRLGFVELPSSTPTAPVLGIACR